MPIACKPGQSWRSCSQAMSLLTAATRVSMRSVSLADLRGLNYRRVRVVQKQFYVIVERTLIAFQRQCVVAALRHPPVAD